MNRDRLNDTLRRITSTFGTFTPGQKAVTIAAVIGLLVGGVFFTTWASKPSYAPLFSNLSSADASAMVEKLSASGAPYQLADGGQTILVPQKQVYDLRLKMSGEGLPAQQDSGYSLLDKQGITTSEFMQQVGYKRALEGELSKTIKSIDRVKAATVHLAIPQKDIFADDEKKPTAAVLVATAPGQPLAANQVQAIVHLVASSIEGLSPDQVTVAGSDGTVLSSGGDNAASSAAGDLRAQQTQQFEQRMGSSLQRMLDQVVGPGHAVVQVSADLDYDQTDTKTQNYVADPKVPPLAETRKEETYTGGGAPNAGGVLGPDNVQVPAGSAAGNYKQSTETRNNAVGVVTETRRSAPGAVQRLSIAVLLDSRTAQGIDSEQVQQLVASAAGVDAKRGDTASVTALPFDQSAAKQAKDALDEAREADAKESMFSLVKTAGTVLVVVLLIAMALFAGRRKRRTTLLTPSERVQLEEMQAALEQARVFALEGGASGALALESGLPGEPIPGERELRQRDIAALIERQPDEVAQMLRGWLADRRG